jgi:hypothetical protein
MNIPSFCSLLPSFQMLFSSTDPRDPCCKDDVNDPSEFPDKLGTTCTLHGCQRLLDEAPLLPPCDQRSSTADTKRRLFPNSWNAIASYSAPRRDRLFIPARRRVAVVRYCPQCREAANRWMASILDERGQN